MTSDIDTAVSHWLNLSETAGRLGVTPGHVRQLLRARELIAIRRVRGGDLELPADLLDADHVVKGLSGTLVLLEDAGYDAEESIRWLVTSNDALGRSPLEALHANRPKEVHRQAQILGF